MFDRKWMKIQFKLKRTCVKLFSVTFYIHLFWMQIWIWITGRLSADKQANFPASVFTVKSPCDDEITCSFHTWLHTEPSQQLRLKTINTIFIRVSVTRHWHVRDVWTLRSTEHAKRKLRWTCFVVGLDGPEKSSQANPSSDHLSVHTTTMMSSALGFAGMWWDRSVCWADPWGDSAVQTQTHATGWKWKWDLKNRTSLNLLELIGSFINNLFCHTGALKIDFNRMCSLWPHHMISN